MWRRENLTKIVVNVQVDAAVKKKKKKKETVVRNEKETPTHE